MPAIARAAVPTQLRISSPTLAREAVSVRIVEAIGRIQTESGGEVKIDFFPGSTLGPETEVLSQVRSGALDACVLSTIVLSSVVPRSSLSGVGFAFTSYDEVFRALDGELGSFIKAEIKKAGLTTVGRIFNFNFRNMTSTKRPIRTPDDLRGFKMRVPNGALWLSMFKAFDAGPISVNYAELYSALQTGLVDGTDLGASQVVDAQLGDLQHFIAVTNHLWDGPWVLANSDSWNDLPAEHRALIEKHLTQAALEQREDTVAADLTARMFLTQRGVEVFEVDRAQFKQKLSGAGFYAEWKRRFGPDAWGILERAAGGIS